MAGQRIELPTHSMFVRTPVYELEDGTVVFGLMHPAVVPHPSDRLLVLPTAGEHRLDLVSTEYYGTPSLWWVIASVNNILDPLLGVPPGTRLRIPARERLALEGVLDV